MGHDAHDPVRCPNGKQTGTSILQRTWWWRVQREERIWGLGDRWIKFTIAVVAYATQWCIQSPTVDYTKSGIVSPANSISLFKKARFLKANFLGVLLISMRWCPCKIMLPSCGQTLRAHRSHLQIESYNLISTFYISSFAHKMCDALKPQGGNSWFLDSQEVWRLQQRYQWVIPPHPHNWRRCIFDSEGSQASGNPASA